MTPCRLRQTLLVVVMVVVTVKGVVPPTCPVSSGGTCVYEDKVAKLDPSPTSPYYTIGGLFSVRAKGADAFSCGTAVNPAGLMHTAAFLWSVDYWKKLLLANSQVGIGAVVFDSCGRQEQMVQNVLGFEQCNIRFQNLDRHNLVGFVGPTNNMDAMAAATLTENMDLTVISPSADLQALGDMSKYNYFLRTTPSMDVDVEIMRILVQQSTTKFVAAIYEEAWMTSLTQFSMSMKAMNVCVTDTYSMTGQESTAMLDVFVATQLRNLDLVRYIAVFTSQATLQSLVERLNASTGVRDKHFIFIIPSHIRNSSNIFNGSYANALRNALVLERLEPNDTSVATAVGAFKAYWNTLTTANAVGNNPFLADYLAAGTALPAYDVEVSYTIMATHAFVKGVNDAGVNACALQANPNGNYLCSGFFDALNRGSSVKSYIRSSTNYFTSTSNNLSPSLTRYTIHSYRSDATGPIRLQPIGSYSNMGYTPSLNLAATTGYTPGQCQDSPCIKCGEQPTTTTPVPTTTTTKSSKCEPDTSGNYSVVYYPPNQQITGAYMFSPRNDTEFATRFDIGQRWIIALGVLAGLGILAVIVFEIYILYKMLGTRMGSKWRTMWLGQLLLFGLFLCYLTLFAYLPIPTKATCGITRFGVGVSYSICFAVLLVKLMVILTSKSSDNTLLPGDMESPNYLKGIYQFLMFVFVVGVQVVIDTQWLITVPPEAIKVRSNSGDMVWVCNHYTFEASADMSAMTTMASFVRNEFENHLLSLVYIMFLILITTILALNAHGIITNHRESVFIGIAAGFSIPIWLAWTLIGGLNRDHALGHEYGDGCIAFGLFITATLILFSMFLPKVRQLVNMGVEGIYFEDDRETYYAGSVIMAPSTYKSRPNSVIYVNNQGIYSEPVVLGNGDSGSNYLRHPGMNPAASVYSAPAGYVKRGGDSTRGGSVLRVTDDLSGKRPLEKKRPMSEVAYGTPGRPRSNRGTLPRSRSQTNLGAL